MPTVSAIGLRRRPVLRFISNTSLRRSNRHPCIALLILLPFLKLPMMAGILLISKPDETRPRNQVRCAHPIRPKSGLSLPGLEDGAPHIICCR